MGSFTGWAAFYYLLYVAFIPAVNLLIAPLLWLWIHKGNYSLIAWKRYLLINALIGVFGFYVNPYSFFLSLPPSAPEQTVDFFGILWGVFIIGFVFQELLFVGWLISSIRKKELNNLYYTVWTGGFVLLYLVPSAIYLMWVIGK